MRDDRKGAPARNLVGQSAHKAALVVAGCRNAGTGIGYDACAPLCQPRVREPYNPRLFKRLPFVQTRSELAAIIPLWL
jgi:hypothetical protein